MGILISETTNDITINGVSVATDTEVSSAAAKEYLASTDWYVTRFTETGKEIPGEVKIKRDEARLQIQ